MEEWRDRIAHVIYEEEEESIYLSLYEEKYKLLLFMLSATIEERDSIAEDLESLCRDFEGMRLARDMAEAEMRKVRDW
ncbi:hypothetical protein AMTR_s00026p00235000 [Amborella trichopoda]|uniref:Uncharacterized protein n=1 Tax=Amborella trichopoda TaxID=13333 RepID=W1PRI9_AMBTC|nr:hypothetical protein AMTR_s00026p00235000 [Amborella trichopoda]